MTEVAAFFKALLQETWMEPKKRQRPPKSPKYSADAHKRAKWNYYADVLTRLGVWQPGKVERT